ncbi:FAD/NAD-P-binding domain-containing protein [Cylindrobasidium torrendii FP15055 ss-10]|uniref:FAD/NAD-P-binding domain-containing protein n=1 Tax=Cylindrobasidium torrendii FP15055 ss-10 TaxID=1314674 RepID=A0A0D7B962_9AGAR|nr:FAD/NAD-P-binding domain-containing protein [Cylindrobasidium torrendii FP15055 ss-10]
MKVVIIGAGPAGLVACKSLLENADDAYPFDPVVLEQETAIGGTFRYRSYENAALVSSKQLTSFSDFRLPLSHPDHLTLEEYVEYLEAYAQHFDLNKRIQLKTKVLNVRRDPKGGHIVSYTRFDGSGTSNRGSAIQTMHAQYLIVCTGLHVIPSIPSIPGVEHLAAQTPPVKVFHSHEYKTRSQFEGKRVMILGTGETGMDLAYESAKAGAKEVVLCTRAGFLSFPKALNDFEVLGYRFDDEKKVPIDSLITNLAETAYVHPWVAASHIRWFVSDFVIKRLLWVLTGTQAGCNQWVGELEPERLGRAYVFLNKSHKAMPYINRPFRKRAPLLDYMSRYMDPPEDSPPQTDFAVDLAPFPTSFLPNGRAVFPNLERKDAKRIMGRDIRPEIVVFATGYQQDFSMLDPESNYPTPDQASIRNITREGDEDIAFIGFVRPGVGAIPPIAEMQTLFWISLIKGQVRQPLPPAHYHLLVKESARIKYGVDHSTYMSTLAKDIGAAPGLWQTWWEHGAHVLLCYCFGAAFTSFYRLTGPYKSPLAPEVVKTEIWDTITRRGWVGNIVMGLIPMIFYLSLNSLAYVAATVWVACGGDS